MMGYKAREFVYALLVIPGVNFLAGRVVRLLTRLGVDFDGFIFPFKEKVCVPVGDGIFFKMWCAGRDTIASRVHQGGIESFEVEVRPHFLKAVVQSEVVLDIGANTGFYSLLASARKPSLVIYAFEPLPSARQLLEKNVRANDFNNVHISDKALSDVNRRGSFFVPKSVRIATGGSERPLHLNEVEEISCEYARLDDFVNENEISRVDFIKIDTEGTEPLIFSGGNHTIANFRPTIMCEILNNDLAREIESQFLTFNYVFYQVRSEGLKRLRSLEIADRGSLWNFFLVPAEKQVLWP